MALRLLRAVSTIVGVAVVVLVLLRLSPGDPARLILGERAPQSAIEALRTKLGLEESVLLQIGHYLGNLAQGDLGTSVIYGKPALPLILEAFGNTLVLALATFAIANLIAIPVGIISAAKRGSPADHVTLLGLLTFQSLPTFWIGILLISLFSVRLGWLPASGTGGLEHLILPAITDATFQVALVARAVRSGMIESLSQDYIRTAMAKGMSRRRVLLLHAFPNTLIPVSTILALNLGAVLGGAFITEVVFAWPGLGRLSVTALERHDFPLALAIVMFTATIIVLTNLLVDLLQPVIDKRLTR